MPSLHRALLLVLLAPAGLSAQTAPLPLKHALEPTTAEITPADLMTRLYIYADDSMMGRRGGTIYNLKATDYIAAEARAMGLVPAGDSGTYFQTVPLVRETIDTTSTLVVAGSTLRVFDDFLPRRLRAGPARSLDGAPVVFGGTIDGTEALQPDVVRGALVVMAPARTAGPNTRAQLGALLTRFGAAAGLAFPGLERLAPQFRSALRQPSLTMGGPAGSDSGPLFLQITTAAAERLLGTSLDSARLGATGRMVQAHVAFRRESAPARNVVALVPGRDPALRGEYVAVGAHNDHIGFTTNPVDHDSLRIWNHIVRPEGADDGGKQATPAQQALADSLLAVWRAAHPGTSRKDSIDNGADDDGSGTVSVLEIAQKIASLHTRPKRSILFVWHTGEELGLLGSRWFTDHPTVPRDSIVAQLNIDMIGRGDADDVVGRTKAGAAIHGGPDYLQLVGSRRLSTELGDLVETVNRENRHGLAFDYSIDADGHPANIYCRSDHYSYARYGIPVVFFTTGIHSDYHQVTDEPEYIDYVHMARVASLIEDIAVHVADLDHRVVVDHPKPDPNAACRQ
ncbi:MAG TPA: M28 family peptidase [Gemmatimonadales bacterium]|nr:M28 family peptidase [Gemmatimonadales bacterium]